MGKTALRSLLAAGLGLASALFVAACDDASTPNEISVGDLVITASPASATCTAGSTTTIVLSASGTSATAPTFTFSAPSGPVTVTSSGGAATVACNTPGATTVSYTATLGTQSKSGTIPVTVTAAAPLTVSLLPNVISCVAGQRTPLNAVVTGMQGTATPALTYSASNANATVTANGGSSATIACVTPGTTTVTVSASGSGQTGTASILVSVAAQLAVTPNPATLSCQAGETVSLGLTITGPGGTPTATFQANDGGIVVTPNGTSATVICGRDARTSAVNYSVMVGDQTATGSVPVTITAAPPPVAQLVVSASPTALRCTPGQSTTITLAITGGSGSPVIAYTAQNAAVTVTGTGLTASVVCGPSVGASAIDYAVTSGTQTVRSTVPVTIDAVPVVPTLVVTPTPASIGCFPGQSRAVTLAVSGGTGTPQGTITVPNGNLSVTTTVSGLTANVTCATPGTSALNYTVTSGGQTVSGSIPVLIVSPIAAVSVSPSSLTLSVGATGQLTATVTVAAGAPAGSATSVTWASSDPTIATVDATGLVTAVRAGGPIVVTATSTANPDLRAMVPVTVSAGTQALVASLTVSPTNVTLISGNTQQITATVTLAPGAPVGTSTGVAYSTTNPAVASVSASGLITAAGTRPGVAVITVASVAAPTVTQQVGVIVVLADPVRVTIQSVQVVDALGNLVAADPTNVSGRIIVNLNVDPGAYMPDSIVTRLGTQRVVCQRFSVQLVRALRASRQSGSADFSPVQCILNTAAFDTTTGAPVVLNGAQSLNATVFYHAQGSSSELSQTAVIQQPFTLNNTPGVAVSFANTPTATQVANSGNATGQAIGPTGVLWRAGTVNVKVVPVLYARTGTGSDVLQSLDVTLTDAAFDGGSITAAAVRQADGTFAAVFAGASGTSAGAAATPASPLSGFTSSASGTIIKVANVVGGNITGASVYLNNNGVPQPAGSIGGTIYVDNQNPSTIRSAGQQFPASSLLPGGGSAFVNGSFVFADSITLDPAQLLAARADNGGVDRVAVLFQVSPNVGLPTYVTVANTVALAPTSTSTAYLLRTRFVDALGNAGNSAASSTPFGVDVSPPGFSAISGPANRAQTTTTQTIVYQGLTDNAAGVNLAAALVVNARRLATAGNTSTGATILACPLTATQPDSSTTLTRICPTIDTANPVSFAQNGYYAVTTQARDRANNLTSSDTRLFAIDFVAPTLAVQGGAPSVITRGQPVTFANFTATDNLDLIQGYSVLQYQNGAINLAFDGPQLGTLFDQVLTTSATPLFTIPVFTGQVDTPDIGLNPFTGFTGFVSDAGRNLASASLLGAQGNVTPGGGATAASPPFYNGAQTSTFTVDYGAGITQLSYGGNTNGSTAPNAPITFVLSGPTGTFVNPAARVELRSFDPALNAYRTVATFAGPTQSDNAIVRQYMFTGLYAPRADQFVGSVPSNVSLRAVAFRANGDVIASAPVTVTLVP